MARRSIMGTARVTLLAVTALVASAVPLAPAVAGQASCFGVSATITGTGGDDRLRGTSGPDVIVAGARR